MRALHDAGRTLEAFGQRLAFALTVLLIGWLLIAFVVLPGASMHSGGLKDCSCVWRTDG